MTAELVCAATDPAWLERRREGITATDIVTIAGLVTWDSPWALYHRKLGLLPEVVQSDRMRLGSWLEVNIAEEWFRQNGYVAIPDNIGKPALYRHSDRIWQMATPDVSWKWRGGGVLECKTTATRDGWGADGTDQVPAHVRAQVLWQMDTLGVSSGHVAVVFLPSGEFRSYTIRQMPDSTTHEIEIDRLRALGRDFWQGLVDRRPPDLDGLEVTTDALRYLHPAPSEQIELDHEGYQLLCDYDVFASNKRWAEQNYREVQNKIRAFMGDATEATVDGRVVFRRAIGKRAGYVVPPGETDTLRRIGKDKD